MWNVNSATIVLVVSANGLIPKSIDIHLRKLALGGWIKGIETKIQKAVLLETARIVRRFLYLDHAPTHLK